MLIKNLNCPRLSEDCGKCFAKRSDGTINRHEWMTAVCTACKIPTLVEMRKIGEDSWNRPLYVTRNGMMFCDTNLGNGDIRLFTMTEQGEPDCPVSFPYHVIDRRAELVYDPKWNKDLPYCAKIITNGIWGGVGQSFRTEDEARNWVFENYGDIEIVRSEA